MGVTFLEVAVAALVWRYLLFRYRCGKKERANLNMTL
jgi:hypothetical protein